MARTVAIVGLCVTVSHTLARQTYPILLTAIQDEFGLTNRQAAALVTATFLAYMVGVAAMTHFSGRTEPKATLVTGLSVAAAGFCVLAAAPGFWTTAAGIGLAGLGSAGIWLSAPALITAAVSIERRGLAMGYLSSCIGVGLLAVGQGVRLVRSLAGDDTLWRPVWAAAAVYTVALTVLAAVALRPPRSERVRTGLNLDAVRQVPGWVPLTIGYLLFGFLISAYAPFLGAALEADGFSRAHVATLYSLIGAAAIVGAMAMGRLSDLTGRRPMLALALVGMAVASVLVVTGREPFATISVLVNGATSYSFPILVTAQIRDHLHDRAFSNALGAITFVYGLSLVVGPILAGLIADSRFGFDGLYLLTAAVAVLGSAVVMRLPTGAGATTVVSPVVNREG